MNIEKGTADRRLAPEDYMEVTARLGTWGGYFFFAILQTDTIFSMSEGTTLDRKSVV